MGWAGDVLQSVAATLCDDNDVGVWSGHKPQKRQRAMIDYMHKGYTETRTPSYKGQSAVYEISFLDNGLASWKHGTTQSNALFGKNSCNS